MHRCLVSTAVLTLAMGGFAQNPHAVEDVFPSSSFACVQFGGLKACRDGANELGLVKLGRELLESDAAAPHKKELHRLLSRELPQMHSRMQRAGINPAALRGVLQNGFAVGVGRPTFFAGTPMPSIAIAIDVAGHEDDAADLLEVAERWLRRSAPGGLTRSRVDVRGVPTTMLAAEGHSGVVATARIGRYMVVSNSKGYLADCIKTCQGEGQSLATSAGYNAARRHLPERVLFGAYLNIEPLGNIVAPFLPYEMTGVCDALGASELDGLFVGVTTSGHGSLDVSNIGIKGDEAGLLRSALGRPASFATAALCPEDTLLFATGSMDTSAVIAALGRFVESLPPEAQDEIQREVVREMERELRHVGMTLPELGGLARVFGPELTVAVTTPAGASLQPEIMAFLDVTDVDKAKATIDQFLGHADGLRLKTTKYKGTSIVYSRAFSANPAVPYTPAMALHENRLVLASSVQTLKRVLSRAESPGQEDVLAAQADFAAQMQSASSASMFACLRLNAAIPRVWRTAEPWIEKALVQIDENLDLEMLPSPEELAAAVSDSVMSLTVNEHGVTAREEHVIGLGALVAVGGMLLDEALGAPVSMEAHDAPPPPRKPKPQIF